MTDTREVWIDAQLSPALAAWIEHELGIAAQSASRLGLRDATDEKIFQAARAADAVVLTKDADFVRLLTARRRTWSGSRSATRPTRTRARSSGQHFRTVDGRRGRGARRDRGRAVR